MNRKVLNPWESKNIKITSINKKNKSKIKIYQTNRKI